MMGLFHVWYSSFKDLLLLHCRLQRILIQLKVKPAPSFRSKLTHECVFASDFISVANMMVMSFCTIDTIEDIECGSLDY